MVIGDLLMTLSRYRLTDMPYPVVQRAIYFLIPVTDAGANFSAILKPFQMPVKKEMYDKGPVHDNSNPIKSLGLDCTGNFDVRHSYGAQRTRSLCFVHKINVQKKDKKR